MHTGLILNPTVLRPGLGMAMNDTKQNLLGLNAASQIPVLSSKKSDLRLRVDIGERDSETEKITMRRLSRKRYQSMAT